MKKTIYILIFLILSKTTIHAQDWQSMGKGITPSNAHSVIIASTSGSVYAAYTDLSDGLVKVLAYDGKKWSAVGKPASDGPAKYISLAIYNNNPCVAYRDDKSTRAMVRGFNGKNWEDVSKTGPSEGYADEISLRADKNNNLYIAFDDQKRSSISVMQLVNGQWKDVSSNPIPGSGNYVCLSFDNLNQPVVAYADNNHARAATAKKLVKGTWVDLGNMTASAHEAKYISCETDASGKTYIAYQDAFDGNKILVKTLGADNKWTLVGDPVFTSLSNDNVSFTLCGGNPYIAFHDSRNFDHNVAVKKYANGKWTDAGAVEKKGGNGFVALVANPNNQSVILSYNDDKDENRSAVKMLSGTY